MSGYRVESCGGGFYEFCNHPDAVLCCMLNPDLVVHKERDDCPIKGPHQISECGAFREGT